MTDDEGDAIVPIDVEATASDGVDVSRQVHASIAVGTLSGMGQQAWRWLASGLILLSWGAMFVMGWLAGASGSVESGAGASMLRRQDPPPEVNWTIFAAAVLLVVASSFLIPRGMRSEWAVAVGGGGAFGAVVLGYVAPTLAPWIDYAPVGADLSFLKWLLLPLAFASLAFALFRARRVLGDAPEEFDFRFARPSG